MSDILGICCLVNDAAAAPGLPVEHGLSFLIETGGQALLFDTGQSGLVASNARALGFDLAGVRHIVLSHGHYDHTGGLAAVLELAPRGTLYLHPAAFEHKYSRSTGVCREIGFPRLTAPEIERRGWNIIETLAPTEVMVGLHATGPIPRRTAYEDVGGPFFLDAAGTVPDPIVDDQAVYILSRQGLVVVLGCGHAGVINTLDYVQKTTGGERIHAVIGGLHLLNASPERLAATMEALKRFDVDVLAPCHCTGEHAFDLLRSHFPLPYRECGAGSRFAFELR